MKKTAIPHPPCYFDRYMDQVADIDLNDALRQSLEAIDALDRTMLQALGDQVYAPGKWTTREVFQHITDCERVFAYRALRFARNDQTALPGFDENLFAEYAGANRRPLETVLAELRSVRESTLHLFESFDEAALRRTGVMFNTELPVLAVGFTLVGHQVHHFRILEERYYPLAR
ncbi:MAG: DinB family protein [Saprospiraceae bacterium]|nr:DinB family protein [Saprospiraceae bacterium]